jgi:hypothetical protein
MAVVLAAVSGLAAGLYGLAFGLCFAAISGSLAGVLPCGLGFALSGAAAGAIVGAFGTLVSGEPIEDGASAQPDRPEHALARKSAIRVWSASPDPDEMFQGEGMPRSTLRE